VGFNGFKRTLKALPCTAITSDVVKAQGIKRLNVFGLWKPSHLSWSCTTSHEANL